MNGDSQMYQMGFHLKRDVRRELALFKKPERLECPFCGKAHAKEFMLLVDTVADSNLAMIGCARCQRWTYPFEMRKPQANDERARAAGLWVPTRELTLDFEMDEN